MIRQTYTSKGKKMLSNEMLARQSSEQARIFRAAPRTSCTSISCATRSAMLMAATRRGCVQAIRRCLPSALDLWKPACTRNWGICSQRKSKGGAQIVKDIDKKVS